MPNKIAPNEENSTALVVAVGKWKYDTSVRQITPKVMKWKGLTVEIARELYLARDALNGQSGQRKDPDAPDYIQHTWADYCDAIGVSKRTANGWLSMFVPAELSDSGEDILMDQRPPAQDAEQIAAERYAREERIASYRATGTKPEGWTDEDEIELRKRLANERIHKLAMEMHSRRIGSIKPKRDYLSEVAKNTKTLRRFSMTPDQQILEADLQSTVKSFFFTFNDPENRLKVAYNLSMAIKDLVNELTEYDMQDQSREAVE